MDMTKEVDFISSNSVNLLHIRLTAFGSSQFGRGGEIRSPLKIPWQFPPVFFFKTERGWVMLRLMRKETGDVGGQDVAVTTIAILRASVPASYHF